MKKAIIISAVNLRKGGTLTILQNCLLYLSESGLAKQYRIIALVHDKSLAFFPHIEYLEFPGTIKSWGRRLWCEYVSMYALSKKLGPVRLWLSLHDITPNVIAEKRAVYCQTSFPFLKPRWRDLLFDYKIVLFSLFTRFAYSINIQKDNFLIVQTAWLRKGFSNMFHLDEQKFIVAPPEQNIQRGETIEMDRTDKCFTFLFPATPDCHKNFEVLCRAAQLLESEVGKKKFKVVITINGQENRYARWLYKKWGQIDSIDFTGFLSKQDLYNYYASSNCLIFPSRVETWGLPISEFSIFRKPLLLADLPYAHETAQGMDYVSFFDPDDSHALKDIMKKMVLHQSLDLKAIPKIQRSGLYADTWKDLFLLLLSYKD